MIILKVAISLLALSIYPVPVNANSAASAESCGTTDLGVPPFIAPLMFRQGQILPALTCKNTPSMDVNGCCSSQAIGAMPQMTNDQSIQILSDAKQGWEKGNGEWTQMTLAQRITAIEDFISILKEKRDEIIKVLMWEIGKNFDDASSEFDRTVIFIQETIKTIQTIPDFHPNFKKVSSANVFIRRNAFGIVLALGPYNYPLNETYATIIPALLMGNVVILKIPQVGGLAHLLTFEAFSRALPKNTIHFISGSGRKTLPPLMESGDIDGLAFIGGKSAADTLIKQHPEPHRLKIFLQLEAKNMAVVMKDMMENQDGSYPTTNMFDEIITGALSYNGQRCTALKIIFVPKGYGKFVAEELSTRVDGLYKGMPWEVHDEKKYSQITPLPNEKRVEYMQELLNDAISKGAIIANKDGGKIVSEHEYAKPHDASTLMIPGVLYNVTPDMKLFTQEQFGPLIPVVEYDTVDEVLSYGLNGIFGQQVAIFTNEASSEVVSIVDTLSAVLGKININSQCARSPDSVPFTARRSSGLGVMSIEDALKEFSIPTVVSFKHEGSRDVADKIQKESRFMQPL
jgi:glyceraldehyde-3-phosphate dehydrogenase (NADP+)